MIYGNIVGTNNGGIGKSFVIKDENGNEAKTCELFGDKIDRTVAVDTDALRRFRRIDVRAEEQKFPTVALGLALDFCLDICT